MPIPNWVVWALGSAGFAALMAVLAKVGVTGISPDLATTIRTGIIFLFSIVLTWAVGEARDVSKLAPRTWMFLIFSGLATGLSRLCYFRALQLGRASQVAPVDKLSVVFVLVLAAVFLGEKLTWHQWSGGTLILAGAVIIALKPA